MFLLVLLNEEDNIEAVTRFPYFGETRKRPFSMTDCQS